MLDAGPGQDYLWHLMLAQQGYVVASVDNRGTPAPRGRDWRKVIYGKIGVLGVGRPGRRPCATIAQLALRRLRPGSASGAGAAAAR